MKGFTLAINCEKCGREHELPLDVEGVYRGPRPCEPNGKAVVVRVDPREWELKMAQVRNDDRHARN